ncbi:MAG: GNAT family N-acetyltransferase [Egibacteraceae bacterium]
MRPFRESDLPAYTAVLQAEEVRASLHLPADVGRERAWTEIALWLGQWELRGTGQWAVEEKGSGAFVGRAGLHYPERCDWPGIEVGWTLHPSHWGKGYATEAGARAIAYAFGELGAEKLFSMILPENRRSIALARRLRVPSRRGAGAVALPGHAARNLVPVTTGMAGSAATVPLRACLKTVVGVASRRVPLAKSLLGRSTRRDATVLSGHRRMFCDI